MFFCKGPDRLSPSTKIFCRLGKTSGAGSGISQGGGDIWRKFFAWVEILYRGKWK
jgi:hypothetical protein